MPRCEGGKLKVNRHFHTVSALRSCTSGLSANIVNNQLVDSYVFENAATSLVTLTIATKRFVTVLISKLHFLPKTANLSYRDGFNMQKYKIGLIFLIFHKEFSLFSCFSLTEYFFSRKTAQTYTDALAWPPDSQLTSHADLANRTKVFLLLTTDYTDYTD